MASFLYNVGKKKMLDGSIDLDTDTIRLSLHTSSYTPDMDAHDFFDDITNEVVGTGYTAGGYALTNKTLTVDTANDRVVFDADDVVSLNTTVTYRYGVLRKDTGTPATSPVIALIDFITNKVYSAETLLIQWNASGIFYLS